MGQHISGQRREPEAEVLVDLTFMLKLLEKHLEMRHVGIGDMAILK